MTYLHQFLLYSLEDSGFERLGDTSRVYNNRAGGGCLIRGMPLFYMVSFNAILRHVYLSKCRKN